MCGQFSVKSIDFCKLKLFARKLIVGFVFSLRQIKIQINFIQSMASHSAKTLEKPISHIGLPDWHSRVNQLRHVANSRCNDAFDLRNFSRTLRNETLIQTDWSVYESNEALAARIAEVRRWQTAIRKLYNKLTEEVGVLKKEHALTENELEANSTPLLVVNDCLAMRDTRLGSELTYDEADTELKKELALVKNNHRLLKEQCNAAWEKIIRLEEVEQKLLTVIDSIEGAIKIDNAQLELNKNSSNITFKFDATRHPKGSVSYEVWLESIKDIEKMAQNQFFDTFAVRESLCVCRDNTRNILAAQQDRTEHALRKRLFETQRARNELAWQKLKMNDEMKKVCEEGKMLEQALREKTNSLKLAETRLANRAERLGLEKCLDEAYDQLCEEVTKLRIIRRNLMDQILSVKTSYNLLEEHERKIDADTKNKEHSLMTDKKALDIRERLRGGESTQTDRNLKLTKMEDEIPKH